MTDPTIPRALLFRARTVILQLELTSNGTTTAWNTSGAAGPAASKPPTNGDPTPPHLHYHQKMQACTDERALLKVVQHAETELAAIRHGQANVEVKPETQAQLHARIVREGEGWTAKEVALHMRCLERDVLTARKTAGREPTHGRVLEIEQHHDRDTRRARVRELHDQGMSMTAIALLLNKDKATISRDLKRAA